MSDQPATHSLVEESRGIVAQHPDGGRELAGRDQPPEQGHQQGAADAAALEIGRDIECVHLAGEALDWVPDRAATAEADDARSGPFGHADVVRTMGELRFHSPASRPAVRLSSTLSGRMPAYAARQVSTSMRAISAASSRVAGRTNSMRSKPLPPRLYPSAARAALTSQDR